MNVVQHLRRNLVAYLALFVALSSTGYAASARLLPKNSVGSAQVINNSLLKRDFKRGQLPRGPQGIPGPQGIQGAAGAAGPTHVTFVHTALITAPTGTATSGRADCPSGQVPTGGGAEFVYIPGETRESIKTSIPVKWPVDAPYPTAWLAWVNNTTGSSVSFLVYAICVTPTSVS
jgi:hypothetical protein